MMKGKAGVTKPPRRQTHNIGKHMIITCLPFGLRSAPRLFNLSADLL